jgi:UDP-glucose 4-epimerase
MKYIVVTGGAGFIGTNLIKTLAVNKKYKIISIDNYFSGSKKNHIKAKNVQYINGNTKNISKILNSIKKKISVIFHFAEFSRIAQSFEYRNNCFQSNTYGSYEVINFCLLNNIKIIYSATSASLGNNGLDQNLSPYAFTKSNNMNLIMNLNEWFGLKYEIIYFYNVYGPHQIYKSDMAAVIGIFEENFKKKRPLPVVKPGSQSRKFTHVQDTVETCIYAWKKNKNAHYSISNNKSYSIIQLAKLFSNRIKMIPERRGERFNSSIVKKVRNKKIFNLVGKRSLHKYVRGIKKNI